MHIFIVILADSTQNCAIASDGEYLYLLNKEGIFKVGSGYKGTIKVCKLHSRMSFLMGFGPTFCIKIAVYFPEEKLSNYYYSLHIILANIWKKGFIYNEFSFFLFKMAMKVQAQQKSEDY